MGRSYAASLDLLADVYAWATSLEVEGLAAVLNELRSTPTLYVGSGGSLSVAHFAAMLHEFRTGAMAKAVTPLELAHSGEMLPGVAAVFLSANGRNPDITGAFRQLTSCASLRSVAVCLRRGSPLAQLARRATSGEAFEFDLPSGSDGFLATNSILALATLLYRAYVSHARVGDPPLRLSSLLAPDPSAEQQEQLSALWTRKTLVVLYGPWGKSAATDIESKFTESALGVVQIADYRNFAHGRHHWLAEYPESSAVLALVTPHDQRLADQTLGLLPPTIPACCVTTQWSGPLGGLALLVQSLLVAGHAAVKRNVDLNRPGIPRFGRAIYYLRAFPYGRDHGRNDEGSRVEHGKEGVNRQNRDIDTMEAPA